MSTSVNLGNGDETLVRVTVDDADCKFVLEFAKNSFQSGQFRSKAGRQNSWLMDCRSGLGNGAVTQALAAEIIRVANAERISQFVGTGFGAYLLVGAILGLEGNKARGGLLRPDRKRYGTEQIIEGNLSREEPVFIVDDILNSGDTACRMVRVLRDEGYDKISLACIFNFEWGGGVQRLAKQRVDCTWLAGVTKLDRKGSTPQLAVRRLLDSWRSWLP